MVILYHGKIVFFICSNIINNSYSIHTYIVGINLYPSIINKVLNS